MKKRILFVDDDPVLVRVYATVLQGANSEWDVRSATSGKQALEIMAHAPLDVLVADMRMPNMTGIELMAEVRKRHPRTSRVILSGIRDQAEVARSLADTHQFIPKPVNLETLRGTLSRLCNLDAYLMDDKLRALIGQFDQLPSYPSLYLKIMSELAETEPSIIRIGDIVAQDPAMTAKILHIVNSASFGLPHIISSPFDAVQYLGTGTVRSLALTLHVVSSFDQNVKGFSIEHFAEHTLRCANMARSIMQSMGVGPAGAEDAYLAGMLHDIGKLMLASSLPDKYQAAEEFAVAHQVPLNAAEMEIFGATHGGVGAYLLGLWGLPVPIVEAVAFHHTPRRSTVHEFGLLTAVHIADALDEEKARGNRPMPLAGLDSEYLNTLNLGSQLAGWRTRAHGQ